RVARRDGGVGLSVQDDGEGIPQEQLARIFEPHFSTRSSGTGLGLAIVRRLVESWGGNIEADSEAGVGTVIRVWIPGGPASDVDEAE
ncbi:MAG TPA: sensor histidine kinase, partial [Longimicrobiales bacterium]|nr:sensor histidine kinase [Longimicrobiales bacterium]